MPEAGYSGTPLAKKLGIKAGSSLVVLGAPAGFDELLAQTLPDAVTVRSRTGGKADVVISFHTGRADLERKLAKAAATMEVDGGLWIAWPKQASGMATDITGDVVREVVLPTGLVDVKVCAIDETWSGLRVCWRKDLRSTKR